MYKIQWSHHTEEEAPWETEHFLNTKYPDFVLSQIRCRTDTANQRGGSEWEPIKILLERDENSNKMNTTSNTRLRLTTQVGQAHVATRVPLDLGTNTQPSDPRMQQNTKPRLH
jgi:hypothetical protein